MVDFAARFRPDEEGCLQELSSSISQCKTGGNGDAISASSSLMPTSMNEVDGSSTIKKVAR